jgi:hypothetical protein
MPYDGLVLDPIEKRWQVDEACGREDGAIVECIMILLLLSQ